MGGLLPGSDDDVNYRLAVNGPERSWLGVILQPTAHSGAPKGVDKTMKSLKTTATFTSPFEKGGMRGI
jgi:hypothetical protein